MFSYFFSIFFGTFVLEDVALVSSILLVNQQKISYLAAFTACFLGISIGDIALYGIGKSISVFKLEKKFKFLKIDEKTLNKFKNSSFLSYSIVISRLMPGTRLPTYLSAGFVSYPFLKFTFLTFASVFAWVLFAFIFGNSLQKIISSHWMVFLIILLIGLHFSKTIVTQLSEKWRRKAFLQSWRKWTHFEFWPAWFFYLPLVPYYVFLSIKFRNILTPFYANPHVLNGGLIGESKWDFLKFLKADDSATLRMTKIEKGTDFANVQIKLQQAELIYPFVLKPDVGQRGFAVRIIRSDDELREYLELSHFDIIAQRLSLYKKEAGLFYIRKPNQATGDLFSITDKDFPEVKGDGITQLGDLIIKDSRAKIIAQTYYDRLADKLEIVPKKNECVQIAECGNHCQGAIFKNGASLKSAELVLKVDQIAKQLPDFYFGRFDIRYQNESALKNGEFEIIEINGAGAEATHIWDPSTKLIDAYRTLFLQWHMLFEIGHAMRLKNQAHNVKPLLFLKESTKVFFRKGELSTSS